MRKLIGSRVAREAGRLTAMVPLAGLAALICVGIAVDFSGRTIEEQNLRDLASSCARVGAQVPGMEELSLLGSVERAYQCLDEHGRSGTVTISGDTLTVYLEDIYVTKLLGIIKIDELPIRATASATMITKP
ncbi:MAG: hypothetical protein LBE83_09475 [Propionibacteriaceae bacterium]|jgi:hypothetical protein|nr:hypothetical protein [Propionibacteriaceae bacterium]